MSRWLPLTLSLLVPGVASAAPSLGEGSAQSEVAPHEGGEEVITVAGGRPVAGAAVKAAGGAARAASSGAGKAAVSGAARAAGSAARSAPAVKAPAAGAAVRAGAAAGAAATVRPPAGAGRATVQGGAKVYVAPKATVTVPSYQPPPPPSAGVPPRPGSTVVAGSPPPPHGVRPPPPGGSGGGAVSPPRVYVYPRVYTNVWGWWWWTPPWYYNEHHHHHHYDEGSAAERPATSRRERSALHVDDYSFGLSAGVQHGFYADGTHYSDPGLKFSLRYRGSDHLGMEVAGAVYSTALYPAGEKTQHRTDVPLQLSSTFHAFPSAPVQLYAMLGLSADYRDFQKVDYASGEMAYQEERFQDLRIGPHVGLGMEVMVGRDVSVHADVRSTSYVLVSESSLAQTDASSLSANLGMSFFF